jgi:hypothetical protein
MGFSTVSLGVHMPNNDGVDLQNLERIAAQGAAPFRVLVGSLMQYNALLFAAFAVIATTSTVCSNVTLVYMFVAIFSLLLPLASSLILRKELQVQADNEIRRLYQASPEIFKDRSDKFKAKYEKAADTKPNNQISQWAVQKAAVWVSITHTIILCAIAYAQFT